ncbi:translesion DNA synthesis-associated protein ImuA [Noviherbaspirillum pedocola]|uniref:Translesion DNA synthesis-associated protein ImuA n=1 Tax=Noviherbaspirillum pedocola TaxID=2801341 RepID=A0A934SXD2_9BURK|nr:translesion DNA synthesis-associated protein ImuA [Noviherbaspirillum pedocola]MBK4734597.1 translesion DNA synthesis-associated protein ImuA [Noviherbaspirillum pedocola]
MSGVALRSASSLALAALHQPISHAVWRADQMGACEAPVTATGHAQLDAELPNGGWPASTLIELLLQQPGIGEMRLLQPALAAIAKTRRVVLVQPPHAPQIAAWSAWGLPHEQLLWLKTPHTADALWSAEQILRNGSCGALLFWQSEVRAEALRRLHLAAQASSTVFWMLRPLSAAAQPSPAPLRLVLRPDAGGIAIDIIKRRGPLAAQPLHLPLDSARSGASHPQAFARHASLDRRAPAAAAA